MGIRRFVRNCCYCCLLCQCCFKCQRSFCVCMINAYLLIITSPLIMLVLFSSYYGGTLKKLDNMVKRGDVITSNDMETVLTQFYIVDSCGILLFILFLCSFIPACFCVSFMEYHFVKMRVYFNEIMSLEMITRPICTPFSETQKVYTNLHRLSQQIQDFKSFLPPHLLPGFEPSAPTPRPSNMVDRYMTYENYVTRCESEFETTDENFSGMDTFSTGSATMGTNSTNNQDFMSEGGTDSPGGSPQSHRLATESPPSKTPGLQSGFRTPPPKLTIPASPMISPISGTSSGGTLGSPIASSKSNNEKYRLMMNTQEGAIVKIKISSFLRLLDVYPQVFLSLHSEVIGKIEEIVQANNGTIQSFDEKNVTLMWCGKFMSSKKKSKKELDVQIALYACTSMVEILRFFYHKVMKSFPFLTTIRMSCVFGNFFLSTMGSNQSKRSVIFGEALDKCDIFLGLAEFWNVTMIIDAVVAKHSFGQFFVRIVDSTEIPSKQVVRFYQLLGSRKNENSHNRMNEDEDSFIGSESRPSSCSTTPVCRRMKRMDNNNNNNSSSSSTTTTITTTTTDNNNNLNLRKEEILLLMYDKAYQLFANGNFEEALDGFKDILEVWQDDRVSILRKIICGKAIEAKKDKVNPNAPVILSTTFICEEVKRNNNNEEEEEEGEGEGTGDENFDWIKVSEDEKTEEVEVEDIPHNSEREDDEEEDEDEEEIIKEIIDDDEDEMSDELVDIGKDQEQQQEKEKQQQHQTKTYSLTKRVEKKFEVRLISVEDNMKKFVDLQLME